MSKTAYFLERNEMWAGSYSSHPISTQLSEILLIRYVSMETRGLFPNMCIRWDGTLAGGCGTAIGGGGGIATAVAGAATAYRIRSAVVVGGWFIVFSQQQYWVGC